MKKIEAITALEESYSDLRVYSIVEDPDMFIAQMMRKDGESVLGGTKGVYKKTRKTIEINPLKRKGLVRRLMDKSAIIRHQK